MFSSAPSGSAAPTKKFYALHYKYIDEIFEKRPAFRPAHLAFAEEWKKQGKFMMGGAYPDKPFGALLVFSEYLSCDFVTGQLLSLSHSTQTWLCPSIAYVEAESKEEVEKFATQDPYVLNGLVTEWTVREWTVVVNAYE